MPGTLRGFDLWKVLSVHHHHHQITLGWSGKIRQYKSYSLRNSVLLSDF